MNKRRLEWRSFTAQAERFFTLPVFG